MGLLALFFNFKQPRQPAGNPLQNFIELYVWDTKNTSLHLGQTAWCNRIQMVADHPISSPINRNRWLRRPWTADLRIGRGQYHETRTMQCVLVGNYHNRPRFPHFRQLRVEPEVAPVDLSVLWGRYDTRRNSPRPLFWLRPIGAGDASLDIFEASAGAYRGNQRTQVRGHRLRQQPIQYRAVQPW